MFCTNCGQKLSDTAKFCTGCGAKIDIPETVAETPVEPEIEVVEELAVEPELEEPIVEDELASEEPVAATRSQKTAEKKNNGKIIAIIAALVIVVGAGIFMMLPKGENTEDADYIFAEKLEQVKNEDYSDLCRYQIDLLDELKYEIKAFSEDGDIDNSQAYYDKFYAYIEAFRNPGQAALAVKQVDA